jgi:hypothetical protein
MLFRAAALLPALLLAGCVGANAPAQRACLAAGHAAGSAAFAACVAAAEREAAERERISGDTRFY